MAQIRFEDIETTTQKTPFTSNKFGNGTSVGFFSLKNDGDEALVRIMHSSPQDFDILTTHPITLEGKHRRVNCVREATDPLENCPLCSSGAKTEQKIYIHLLQYSKDAQGNVVVEPKVWERPIDYAYMLRDMTKEYGPLTNSLFKIKRRGVAGSRDTKYDFNYAIPTVYPNEAYPNKAELFEGYHALGRAVLSRNADELSSFLATGSFPQKAKPQTQQPSVALNTTTRVAPWDTVNVSSEETPTQAPTRYY